MKITMGAICWLCREYRTLTYDKDKWTCTTCAASRHPEIWSRTLAVRRFGGTAIYLRPARWKVTGWPGEA